MMHDCENCLYVTCWLRRVKAWPPLTVTRCMTFENFVYVTYWLYGVKSPQLTVREDTQEILLKCREECVRAGKVQDHATCVG